MPATPATGMIVFGSGTAPTDAIRDYELDEGTGTTANDTGTQNVDGTITDPDWATVPGKLTFNGSSTYISISDVGMPASASHRSLAMRVNVATLAAPGLLIDYGVPASETEFQFYIGDDHILHLWNGGSGIVGSVVVDDAADHDICVTYDGTTLSIYVDGVLDIAETITLNTSLTGTLIVGSIQSHDNFFLPGVLENLQVFARCLSVGEVAALAGLVPTDGETIRIQDGQGGDETFTFEGTPANPNDFNFDPMGGAFLKDVIDGTGLQMGTAFDSVDTITLTDDIAGTAGNIAMVSGLTGVTVTGMAGGINATLTGSMFGSRFIKGRA